MSLKNSHKINIFSDKKYMGWALKRLKGVALFTGF